MVFTPPFTAVPGEKITSAGWNTSARDNINHIWGVLGGNPGTNNLVPVSSGASSSVWGKLPDLALADQKVSQKNPYAADLNVAIGTGVYDADPSTLNGPSASSWLIHNLRYRDWGVHYAAQIAVNLSGPTMYVRSIVAGVPTSWYRMWNAAGMGSGSGLDADTLRTLVPGNLTGNIPISNSVQNVNLNAAMLAGLTPGSVSGQIPINNGSVMTNLNAQLFQGMTPGASPGNIPINNGVTNVTLSAQLLSGLVLGGSSGNVPVNNGVLMTNLNAQLLNGVQSSGFAPAITTASVSAAGPTTVAVGVFTVHASITIPSAGTYLVMAAGDVLLNPADSNVIVYIESGGGNVSNAVIAGHLESGSRPYCLFAVVTIAGSTTVNIGGQKGGGGGTSQIENSRIRYLKIG